MIAIIDYGVCNVGSIKNMLKKIGVKDVSIVSRTDELMEAERCILPGIGSFDSGMESLEEHGLVDGIKAFAASGRLMLGICLGMQLLGEKSQEGEKRGLELIPMECKRFDFSQISSMKSDDGLILQEDDMEKRYTRRLKIPHMGWDEVSVVNPSPLTDGISFPQRYYFVHSYHAVCDNQYAILSCDYGYPFTATVRNENIYGVQFHPEKSHNFGMRLLKNFVTITREQTNA